MAISTVHYANPKVAVELTARELTLIRVALFTRLDHLKELNLEAMDSYEDSRQLVEKLFPFACEAGRLQHEHQKQIANREHRS